MLTISACADTGAAYAPTKSVKYRYEAVGYASIQQQHGTTHEEKMLNAIKVSKMHAYEELTEHLHGVLVSSQADIQTHQLNNDRIIAYTKGLIKGAKVKKTYHHGDVYVTELQLDIESSQIEGKPAFSEESLKVKGNQVFY